MRNVEEPRQEFQAAQQHEAEAEPLFAEGKAREPGHTNNGADVLRDHCSLGFPFRLKKKKTDRVTKRHYELLAFHLDTELITMCSFHPFQTLGQEKQPPPRISQILPCAANIPAAPLPYYAFMR